MFVLRIISLGVFISLYRGVDGIRSVIPHIYRNLKRPTIGTI